MKTRLLTIAHSLCLVLTSLQAQSWQWVQQFSSCNKTTVVPTIQVDKLNNAFVKGNINGNATIGSFLLDSGMFVIKLDPQGTLSWAQSPVLKNGTLVPDNLGGFYIYTNIWDLYSTQTATHIPISQNTHVITHFNGNGQENWSKAGIGYVLTAIADQQGHIYYTGFNSSDTILLGGQMFQQPYHGSFFLINANPQGQIDWATRGLQASDTLNFSWAQHIRFDHNGNMACIGTGRHTNWDTYGHYVYAIFDTSGQLVSYDWNRTSGYGDPGYGEFELDANDEVYLVSNAPRYGSSILEKYKSGWKNPYWNMLVGVDMDNACAYSLKPRISGTHLYMASNIYQNPYNSQASCQTRGCFQYETFRGQYNMSIQCFNLYGSCQWSKGATGNSQERITDLALDSQGNCYVTGLFRNADYMYNVSPLTLDTYTLASHGAFEELFIAKLGSSITGISENARDENGLEIFPNPATQKLNLQSTKSCRVQIISALGGIVRSFATNAGEQTSVDLTGISQGLYLVDCQSSDAHTIQKLVVY